MCVGEILRDHMNPMSSQTSLHFVPQSDSNGTIEEGLKLFQAVSDGGAEVISSTAMFTYVYGQIIIKHGDFMEVEWGDDSKTL